MGGSITIAMLKKEEIKMKRLLLIVLMLGLFTSCGCAQMAGQKAEGGMQKGR